MLKPASAFVYVFQEASTWEEGACVALTVGVEEGDGGFSANELHDANTITKIRNMDRYLIVVGFCFLLISISPFGFAVRARPA